MTTQPNPFNNTSSSLKGVIDAAASIIGGSPTLPDEYSDHVNSAAEEISSLSDGPHIADDTTKILQKHFNNASEGNPQSTNLQRSFQREVNKQLQSLRGKSKWKDASRDDG